MFCGLLEGREKESEMCICTVPLFRNSPSERTLMRGYNNNTNNQQLNNNYIAETMTNYATTRTPSATSS